LFFCARNILALPLAQLQTLVFVTLVFTGQGMVYLGTSGAIFGNGAKQMDGDKFGRGHRGGIPAVDWGHPDGAAAAAA
jgi:hypothetical protein